MIRTATAFTQQIDDYEAAIAEINEQLSSLEYRESTLGIVTCHYEFVLSGVCKAICESLPFETVGFTSSLSGINDEVGTLQFSIMVFTSDEEKFATLLTNPLGADPARAIKEACDSCREKGNDPSLVFLYGGFIVENVGDEYLFALNEFSNGAPIFGSLAVDDTDDFRYCYVIHNGETYRDRLSLACIHGDITPRFFIASISDNKILGQEVLVTKSERHIVNEINGRHVSDFFESMGLTKASESDYAMTSLPFMVNYNDGTPPVSKVFVQLTGEGDALFAGIMPEGSSVSIGVFDKDDVLLTTEKAVKDAFAAVKEPSFVLAYSCVSRSMTLGYDTDREYQILKRFSENVPMLVAYSGGEFCPTLIREEQAINRFHNNTFVLCIL